MRTLEPEDFDNALRIMEGYGWNQGAAIGFGGKVCAARALNMAAKARSDDWCDLDEARKVMGLDPKFGDTQSAIPRWNDAKSTQWADVQRVFGLAAHRMRERRDAQR